MKPSFNFKEVAPCLFAVFVDILGFSLALPILTSLFTVTDFLPAATPEALRYSYLAIGLALYPCFMFFGSSFMGDLSDIIGRKKVLIFCMAGFCLGFAFMGLGVEMRSLWMVFFGRAFTGLTAASLPTTMAAIVDLSTEENKATHMSYVVLMQSLGFVLGPLMGGVLSNPRFGSFFSDAVPLFTGAIMAFFAFVWIGLAFTESFEKREGASIHPLRLVLVFVEAAKHSRIRILAIAFVLHQLAIGLFMQLILIYLHRTYAYTTLQMGLFNGFFGLWLAIGLFLIPYLSKRFRVEWLACSFVGLLGLAELAVSQSMAEWFVWFLATFVGVFANVAWSTILTSFSNAADANSQGWAMGLTGAIVALSFMVTGFSPNLVPRFGALLPIGFGGILLLISCLILFVYCRKFLREKSDTP